MAELYSFLNMPLTGLNYNNLSFHNGLTLDHSATSQPIFSNTIANSFLLGLTFYCSYPLFLTGTSPLSLPFRVSCPQLSLSQVPLFLTSLHSQHQGLLTILIGYFTAFPLLSMIIISILTSANHSDFHSLHFLLNKLSFFLSLSSSICSQSVLFSLLIFN